MSFLRSLMCTILAHQQLQIVIIFRWKNSQWQYYPCGWLRWKSEILEEETSFDPKWRNFFPPDLKNIHQNFHLGSNIDYYYYVIENAKLFAMHFLCWSAGDLWFLMLPMWAPAKRNSRKSVRRGDGNNKNWELHKIIITNSPHLSPPSSFYFYVRKLHRIL